MTTLRRYLVYRIPGDGPNAFTQLSGPREIGTVECATETNAQTKAVYLYGRDVFVSEHRLTDDEIRQWRRNYAKAS